MLRNYITIAWRNITRNKANSFINIAGLAIGIACVILIALYVQDELQYDQFFKNSERICQVNINGNMDGNEFWTGNTPSTIGQALVNGFHEIESYVRIYRPDDVIVRNQNQGQAEKYFTEKNILGVDSNFLEMFSYQVLEGNKDNCLNKPHSVVITETTAKKYFKTIDVIGKTLLFNSERTPFTITAVIKDPQPQVTWKFDMLTSISSHPAVKQFSWSWVWLQVNTYVKLRDNFSPQKENIASLESKFPAMVKVQSASAFKRIGQPLEEFYKKGGKWDFHLQPLTKVHLYSEGIGSRITTLGDIKYIYIFSVIAIFIIILACVNFMNLTTAQAEKRAREVGVRKVLGSRNAELVKQFLTEAILFSLLATITAFILTILLLQPFNQLTGKEFNFTSILSGYNLIFIFGITIITGLLAGSYPSFYLTSFQPVAVLKGLKNQGSNLSNLFIRNGLVVFQFTVSTIMIICTIIVYKQLQYTQTKNLGLKADNILVIQHTNLLATSAETFKDEITKIKGVKSASISTGIPTGNNFGDGYIPEPSGNDKNLAKDLGLSSFIVDYDFVPALQIQLLQGRNFSKDFSDSASVILNEAAIKQAGWKDPVGKYLVYPGNNNQRFRIIAVAKDFNFESLHNPVSPFALFHTSSKTYDIGTSFVMVRIANADMADALSAIENKWKQFVPATPFDYSFLDKEFDALYSAEKRMGRIFNIFTMLSVFIACLGLFGLVAYTAQRRTKEIGIRKVLGATVTNIVTMLSKDFVKLVIIATLIAFPVAWWYMHSWLQNFAYHINISGWVFFISGLSALILAILTISLQGIKAATSNPIKSLRTE